ncbi:MAG TPA: hypothetical protein VN924_00970 [Bryobacteraceae bacterium]|nr:hypothetical protein [Bryobacteraceae bacterium]
MVFETVRRARHRLLANEALRYAAYSVSAALAALILLLLLGTQILSPAWLIVLPAVTLAAGAYMTWRSAPSPYWVAQRVDHNLELADALSTALFFAPHRQGVRTDCGGEMRRAQWAQAERIAAGVDTRRAIPVVMPRALYGTALLALAAGSLFALRYGLDRRLDLHAPLARIVQDRLGYPAANQTARDRRNPAAHDPKRPEDTGFSLDDSQQKSAGELDAAPDSALDTVDVPNVDNKTASSRPDPSKLAQSMQLEGEQNKSEEPDGVSANPSDQQSAEGRKGPSAGKPGKQGQGDDKQDSGNPGENSGLLGKFRDAMSSLMNRMRPQGGAKGAQQQAGAQNGQQKSQTGNSGQNGKQGQQPGDGQQADAKDGQPGDDSQNAQNAQSGSPGQSGPQPATKQPGSGIGRQDGSKDVKLAEQLAAMGKISEIIGKRAANVTGELTVEVENSNQQLRTPYAQRDAHHTDAGGEINRDEVPVALQAYVQQYFEQVRKQAAQQRAEQPKPPKPGM